jgi:hypothetical protein
LFPNDWFKYLDQLRSPHFRGAFGEGTYEKFSSMGNGSTFCIETLVFAAACKAVGSTRFSVYGDDVIIESSLVEDYIRLCAHLGFKVNVDKSFHEGPFRESCGKDFYRGIECTPVFIRNIDLRKAALCDLVNRTAPICYPGSALGSYLAHLVSEFKLPLVPYTENTMSGVWIEPNIAKTLGLFRMKKYPRMGNYWYRSYKTYLPVTKTRNFVDSRGYYLWFLRKYAYVLFSGPWENKPTSFRAETTSSVPCFQHKYVRRWVRWYDLPPEAIPDHLLWWSEVVAR